MSLSLGFIGAGNMGRTHMKSAQALGFNLAAVADIDPKAGEEARKNFGVAKVYDSHTAMLKDARLDAVIIAVPNSFHREHAVACLDAGKHVFLEKPMATNVGEADAIVAAMKKSGRILQMGMIQRFRGAAQALKKFVDSGRCGHIYSGQTYAFRRRGIPGFGGWFTTKSLSGGGALIDVGVHILDLALYLMGFPKPVAVSGMTYAVWNDLKNYTYTGMWGKPVPPGKKDVDDYALALIRFSEGQTLQLNVSWALNIDFMQPESALRLMGDKAGVSLLGSDSPRIHGEENGHITDTQPFFAKNDPAQEELKHFVECVENDRQPLATAEQGRTVQRLLGAIYQSAQEGREVRLD